MNEHILKAISQTTPYSLKECIRVYLAVDSYDVTIEALRKCVDSGVTPDSYIEGYSTDTSNQQD